MSKLSSLSANRVVSLNGLGRDRSPGHRILGECRDQLVSLLCNWLRDVATPVSEELFVLADSTRERLLQTRYLDLRADIEKDWPHLVETFRRELSAAAERCQSQDAGKEESRETSLDIPDFEGLQLLDDEDLSEHIVIREFSAQLAESCDEELYTLNRRVAVLLGHDEPIDGANPLAPAIVCHALSDSCATIGADSESRLLLLRRLERHLHLALPSIYQKINGNLIDRGILPDLKRTYRRNAGSAEASAPSAPNWAAPGTTAPSSTQQLSGDGILDALQRLAQLRLASTPLSPGFSPAGQVAIEPTGAGAQGPAQTAGMPMPSGAPLDPAAIGQLLSSLTEIQHSPSCDSGGLIVNQVRLVRESEKAQQVGGLEAVTIDIVAMLFDFIFDDAHIPVAIKALISRLQIPVLKVAMTNPGFFADRQHPTRRFLGSISGISIRWGNAVDESDPFYAKLSELVDRIQADFENDVEIFGTALAELDAFVNEREDEEDDTALTAANVVIQHEQIAEGRERAKRAVTNFRNDNPLPPLIDAFLTDHWVSALQAVAIKNDDDSADWKAANDVMKDLVWSIEAKKQPDDRLKLISLLPKLLAQLNKGLDSIDADATKRREFFDALVQYHSKALKGEVPVAATEKPAVSAVDLTPAITPPQEGDLLVTRSVDNGVEVEEVILVGASPIWRADDRDLFRQVSDLHRGDWVEFRDDEGNSNRERLTWISPQRGILLFSNHRSAKAISIAPDALARQIRDGKAAIVREEPIFERALSGALESMNAV
jgi:hypothetical protein